MPFQLGPIEVIIVLVLIFAVFGLGKFPNIGHSIGKQIKDFRKIQNDLSEITETLDINKPYIKDTVKDAPDKKKTRHESMKDNNY
jgi:sec-independent protein translocase protein TatA